MQTADYLIVGQGLNGTLLSYELLANGCTIKVIDPAGAFSASKVAAGIINPVTGRRVVKSWMFETLYPYAEKTYKTLEQKLGGNYFQKKKIYRILFSPGEENKWMSKTAQSDMIKYIDEAGHPEFMKQVHSGFSAGEINNGAQVDIGSLINDFQNYLKEQSLFIKGNLDYTHLNFEGPEAQYENYKFSNVVFCEGHLGRFNPWFSYLPFEVAKGEILLIKAPELNNIDFENYLLKHKLFVVPYKEELFWIGSTYDWEPEHDQPTIEKRQELEATLSNILKCKFEVVAHQAGIRPAIKDRRPILGRHANFPQLAIFNGMGAKGASIAPYWANRCAMHLIKGESIPEEVHIARYSSLK